MKLSKRSTQLAVRSAQWRGFRLTAYCLLLTAYCALSSCGPEIEEAPEFSADPIPRLTKYYPEVNANGDTTYKGPEFVTLVDQEGTNFSTSVWSGRIQVVQVFFTSCEGICPVISGSMQTVRNEFKENADVKLLSFSVDPERDSVAALKKYAGRFECDTAQWRLLTGDKKFIYDQIRYGYRLPDIEPGNGDEEDFIHSDQLVLVDRNNIIRGYYGGTDTAQVRMLIEDIHSLINEK